MKPKPSKICPILYERKNIVYFRLKYGNYSLRQSALPMSTLISDYQDFTQELCHG